MKLSERIRAARQHAGLTQRELAEKIGIAQTAISQLESGKTQRSTYLLAIASACNVSSFWLAEGTGPMLPDPAAIGALIKSGDISLDVAPELARYAQDPGVSVALEPIQAWDDDTPLEDDEVEIPFLREVELSAGSGRTVIERSSTAKLRFGKRSLRAHNVQFDQAVCVVVSGNSMEPVLPDGSTVGVNIGQTQIVDGKMYAIKHDGQLRVKILYRVPGGGVRFRSFNQSEHPDETYSADEMAEKSIEIIGRVFWGASFY
ncbi:helix-turn-helix transcriptional regulator [Pseudomonas asiatica]|uniref:XRE family transcriptional regulator n=1 Tax=Pseudomonas TaxID=286 RepID=UPI0018D5BBF3|nr:MULTISPECIES: helix-turn-helix transcriptional regulator [Pseudomonas]MBH3417583.1 helix-turn-helix transcriptional regulator [Pseudomonas putida]MCO7523952.1 helix-turn-helix transcriptional regulator [Pseudomonas asiatica]MDG9815381.1 helix-turn-helix transcriptional regulator [Pseudomonas putida]